jgi:hypothetical protein
MSYAIINRIKIADGKVMIKSADNNVIPRTPHEWECKSLTEVLQKEGEMKLDIEILKDYESGNFQKGKNKYTRALEVLRHIPAYKKFDWRNDIDGTQELRKSKEFEDLLHDALVMRLPSEKYAITKEANGNTVYFKHRTGSRFCKWYYEPLKATLFSYEDDAVSAKKWFTNSEHWEVIRIK